MRLAAATLLCGLTAAACGPKTVDLRLRFEAGRVVTIALEERKAVRDVAGDGDVRHERTLFVSERTVEAGGTYGVDTLRWTDRVTRVVVEEGGHEPLTWDSASGAPVPEDADIYAALVGMTSRVAVAPSGAVTVSDIQRDLSPLRGDKTSEELLEAFMSEATMGASERAGLELLPRRTAAVGAQWTAHVPFALPGGGAGLDASWELVRVDGAQAHLTLSADVDVKTLPIDATSLTVRGELVFDHEVGLPVRLEQRIALDVGTMRADVVRVATFEVTR